MEHTVRRHTAKWNQSRDCWETPETPIFGLPDVYSETWPASGTTRNGELLQRVPLERPTEGSASSSSYGDETSLLRTVMADELGGGLLHPEKAAEDGKTLRLGSQVVHLVAPEQLKR